jgi:hypothetical protein
MTRRRKTVHKLTRVGLLVLGVSIVVAAPCFIIGGTWSSHHQFNLGPAPWWLGLLQIGAMGGVLFIVVGIVLALVGVGINKKTGN